MKYIFGIFAFLVFCYVSIRVFTVGITYDEGWTYFEYVQYTVLEVVTNFHPRANNHILNTLLTKFCCLFSTHQFALRLPNLLAFILYLYAAYKISLLQFKNTRLQLALFICLITNYTLLEFFGLCRGYGLGIAFLLFSIYQLLLLSENPSIKKNQHLTLAFAVAAMYANFSLLNAVLAIFLSTSWILYINSTGHVLSRMRKAIIRPLVYCIVLLLLCAYPILVLIKANELYYGGTDNIIKDTLSSAMIEYIGYGLFTDHKKIAIVIFLIIIISTSVFVLLKSIGHYKKNINQLLPVFIFIIVIVLINVQFYFLGTKLPISRTALYLYPLMILFLFSGLSQLYQYRKQLSVFFASAFTIFSIYVCATNMNFYKTRAWWTDAHSKEVIKYILAHDSYPKNEKIKLLGGYDFTNSLNFYIERTDSTRIEKTPCCINNLNDIDLNKYDFLYLNKNNDISSYHLFLPVQAYNDSEFILYAKRLPLQRIKQ